MNNKMNSDMIDRKSPMPLYQQITDILRYEAMNGLLTDEHNKIPTEAELSDRFQVSRITVQNAVKKLVDEGLLYRERGKGTFVKETVKLKTWLGKLLGFTNMIADLGYTPSTEVIKRGFLTLPSKASQELLAKEGWEFRRIRYADDIPIGIEHSYLPFSYGEILEKQDNLNDKYDFEYMEKVLGINIKDGRQMISAKNANKEEAKLLNVNIGDSLLYIERVTYCSSHKPTVYLHAVYNPRYFQYYIHLTK